MKKYTLTVLKNLKAGDTFYKDNDKNEIIYQVSDVNCTYGGMMYVKKGDLRLPDMLPKKQSVIFLKHG